MIVVNTETIAGYEVIESKGLVQGNTIRAKHLGRDFAASLKNIVGGELRGYTELLIEARRQALERMLAQAEQLGANAVVNVRFTTSAITQGAAELYAYGTAVVVEANVEGDRLGIAVSDSGQGISEEDQDKLFMPFFRVERDVESAVPGTGLGLAISRSIVELHEGEINVESELGVGSTFWVSIPGVITHEADDEGPAEIEIRELPPSDESDYAAHKAA